MNKIHHTVDIAGNKFSHENDFLYIAEVLKNCDKKHDSSIIEIGVKAEFNEIEFFNIINNLNQNNINKGYMYLLPEEKQLTADSMHFRFEIIEDSTRQTAEFKKQTFWQKTQDLFFRKRQIILGGGRLYKIKSSSDHGTSGAIISVEEDLFIITARHVLLKNSAGALYTENGCSSKSFDVGENLLTSFSEKIDVGLVKIDQEFHSISKKVIKKIGAPSNIRKQPECHLKVVKYGTSTKRTKGIIKSLYSRLNQNGALSVVLFMIKGIHPYSRFGNPGDSGSLILSKDKNPMGILVHVSGSKTFAIPIQLIDNELPNIKFN
ncbi:MAG: hypothetical protein AAF489_09200 [Bacteroidota bacterium]